MDVNTKGVCVWGGGFSLESEPSQEWTSFFAVEIGSLVSFANRSWNYLSLVNTVQM